MKPGVDLAEIAAEYPDARALLSDAFVEGAHGGTGATFDWTLLPEALPLPLIPSGGLTNTMWRRRCAGAPGRGRCLQWSGGVKGN